MNEHTACATLAFILIMYIIGVTSMLLHASRKIRRLDNEIFQLEEYLYEVKTGVAIIHRASRTYTHEIP